MLVRKILKKNRVYLNFFKRTYHSYHENVIDHYEKPRNVGSLDKTKKNVGTGLASSPACDDVMKIQIDVNKDGIITQSKFKQFGSGSAIASSSLATEWIKGMHVDEAINVTNKNIGMEIMMVSHKPSLPFRL